MRLLRRGLVAGALTWAAVLPVATFAAARPQPAAPTYLFAFAVYAIGGAVCHQIGVRSFHLWAHQMPVCARCTGIYLGAAIAAAAALWTPRNGDARESPRAVRLIVGLALLPAIATLVFEWLTGVAPSNVTRAATGIVLGAAAAWVVVRALR